MRLKKVMRNSEKFSIGRDVGNAIFPTKDSVRHIDTRLESKEDCARRDWYSAQKAKGGYMEYNSRFNRL